jgi:uncharacterized membrane protein YbhN (UPF0104 family)
LILVPPQGAKRLLDRRAIAAAGIATLAVIAVATTPQLLGSRVSAALDGLGRAEPGMLWIAALGFLFALLGNAGSWRSAIRMCGGDLSLGDANARFGIGSVVNTFVPARAGDAVRIALFARAVPHRDRLWAAGGAFAALSAARALVLAAVVLVGAAAGAVPLWPVAILLGMVAAAVAAAVFARGRRAQTHVSHVLDAFRALGREPLAGLRLAAWISLAMVGQIAAGTAIAASLGVRSPVTAALLIILALDVAGLIPITPGNVGVTSGAIAMALQAHGIAATPALSAGIAFHAIESATSLVYGIGGALFLAGGASHGARRWVLVATATTACLALGTAFGMTVLVDVV